MNPKTVGKEKGLKRTMITKTIKGRRGLKEIMNQRTIKEGVGEKGFKGDNESKDHQGWGRRGLRGL